jgi:hypothetical protein
LSVPPPVPLVPLVPDGKPHILCLCYDSHHKPEVTPDLPITWTAHPARERPRDLALVAAVLFLTCGATLMAFESLFLTALAAVIVILGVSQFLLPTRYELSDWGVEARGLVRTRARSWDQLRRFEVGPGAALVTPIARRGFLDRYRGIVLLLDGADRERVVTTLQDRIDGPA